MNFSQTIYSMCELANAGQTQEIALVGVSLDAVRVNVSRYNKRHGCRLSVSLDDERNTAKIIFDKKTKALNAKKKPLLIVPAALFVFINGGEVTDAELEEIRQFKNLLESRFNKLENEDLI